MAPKHNKREIEELDNMLESGIITPASSAWSFTVVISTKKDGIPPFCVDYREFNQRMKYDRFLIPQINDILEYMGVQNIFHYGSLHRILEDSGIRRV